MKKYKSLKRMYFGNFLLLIVIPIFLVFLAAIGIIDTMIRNAAIANIKSAQGSMVKTLEGDIKDASLQLSHLVYNDSGNFLQLAAETDTDSISVRNEKFGMLENAFQIAVTPKQDIISMQIYMKDGKDTSLKDGLLLSSEEVRDSPWYGHALENKNTVSIGSYDTGLTSLTHSRQRRWEFIIAAALSPDRALDRSGKLEVTALFYKSDLGRLVKEYEKNPLLGTAMVLDEKGQLIYKGQSGDRGEWYLDQLHGYQEGVFHKDVKLYRKEHKVKKYTYVISELSSTGWKVINIVPTSNLTKRFNQIALVLLLVLMVLFVLFYLFSRYFLRNILLPVHALVEGMKEVQNSNLAVHLEPQGQYEIRQMMHSFNRMVKMLKVSIEENELAQTKKHEAEIKALQSQINPHFLVNTLNSIRFMAQVSKYEGIRKMAESLMRIVSCSFRSNISFYTLREEMEILDSYIYLMKIRYSEGFEVEYDVEEACMECLVPRLILQPLVENSIVHGFNEEDIGHLKISVKRENGLLLLKVWDDGCGIGDEQVGKILSGCVQTPGDNTSIGMENVISRLKLNFGNLFHIDIHSVPKEYTEIVLQLPILEETNEKCTDC
ncbi:cache domain-containing sensor histidine kinase [Blautia producta]|uniref:cache domain-containing sensor histidine kinase n=1 Tax=Blautia producta TaxID=33035 RepID=UPI0031B633AF